MSKSTVFENWNRFYDPAVGRYTAFEPLAYDPKAYIFYDPSTGRYTMPDPILRPPGAPLATTGLSAPTYAYALNNPLRYSDVTGLDPWVLYRDLETARRDAASYLYRVHGHDARIHEWGGTFYQDPWGYVMYSDPVTTGEADTTITGSNAEPSEGLVPIGDFHNHPGGSPASDRDINNARIMRRRWDRSRWDSFVFTDFGGVYQYTWDASPGPRPSPYGYGEWRSW